MSWERRKRGTQHYTRSKKINGRVEREYIGRGPEAEQAAAEDAARQAGREARRAQQHELERLDASIAELCALVDAQVQAHLLTHGYHRPHRGEWRKRRKDKDDRTSQSR
jgi:hypothetical protein